MKKILHTTIVCLLIPSLVLAQIPHYRGNETTVKQTNLSRVWNALNTEVGQQIITYIESTVGIIDLEHAKAFTTANGEVGFVPIKSYSKMIAALCYRQLEDGSDYLFLITYNATEKAVLFTFPSGRMFDMQSSGVTESINPDFQFQQYDDLSNKVSINTGGADLSQLIEIICLPFKAIASMSLVIGLVIVFPIALILWCYFFFFGGGADLYLLAIIEVVLAEYLVPVLPVLLTFTVFAANPSNSNLMLLSILFTLYYYSCFYYYNQLQPT